jgi:hypothetical protein
VEPISIVMGLAALVPKIVGWIKGDQAEARAEGILDIAKSVTGRSDAAEAVEAIKADPARLIEFKAMLLDHEEKMRAADNTQLDIINQTIRAETVSTDGYNRRWRATFGYCVSFAWAYMFFGFVTIIGWVIFETPEQAGGVISAISGLLSATFPLWTVALSILGVTVYKRSKDKEVAAGIDSQGVLGTISQIFKKAGISKRFNGPISAPFIFSH